MLHQLDTPPSSEQAAELSHDSADDKIALLKTSIKELEYLSCTLAHEVRSSFRAINGCASLLAQRHDLDEESLRWIRIINDTTARANGLIEDIVAYARLGSQGIRIEALDMAELANEAMTEVLCGHVGTVPNILMDWLPPTHGDRSLIRQVWVNLIENAIKYSRKAGSPHIQITGWMAESETVYAVKDNGAGFDMRFAHKLFVMFERLHSGTEFPGTGIGLATVKRIVSSHYGRVWAESDPNHGAMFFFALPKL